MSLSTPTNPIYTPGSYACVNITAHNTGAWLADEAIRWFTHSPYCHAFLITSESGEIVQSTPRLGVHRSHISEYASMPMVFSNTILPEETRQGIVKSAYSYCGRDGYGFLDIAYLALYTQGHRWNWLESEVLEDKNSTICSQLVAMCGNDNGVTSWLCGTGHPNLVTPANLVTLSVIDKVRYVC